MSAHNNNNRIRKQNFINACKKHFEDKVAPISQQELLRKKIETLTITIHQLINPIVASGGYLKNPEALRQMIFERYFEAFDSNRGFSREELAAVLAQLHMELMIESINQDPAGTGKPDLLS